MGAGGTSGRGAASEVIVAGDIRLGGSDSVDRAWPPSAIRSCAPAALPAPAKDAARRAAATPSMVRRAQGRNGYRTGP
jgi:hypothetical protein